MILSIMAVKYGESVLEESLIFENGAKDKVRPISFVIYLIKTNKRLILVDAGCDTMPGFEMKNFCSPADVLKRENIDPECITDVVITHSHHDHIDAIRHFKNATVHIQRAEYEVAREYIPSGFYTKVFDDKTELDGVRVVKIGGHTAGSCVVEFEKSKKKFVIVGDECYIRECIQKSIPTGSSYSPDASRNFLEKYKGHELLFCHDYDILPGKTGLMKIF